MAERTLPQRLERAGPLAWLLAAFAGWAILACVAALAGMGGHIAPAQADPPGALPVSKPAVPDRIGPLSQYGEAAARPLFTTDRRPRAFLATSPEGSDGAAPAQSLDFVLTGVLISPQVQLATLQPTGGGESQRVQVGKSPEGAAGWRLVEVQPRRAVFEGGGGQSTLELRTFGASDADREAIARAAPGARPPPAASDAAPAPATSPQNEQQRIEAIRKRIEARRAQIRAQQNNAGASSSASNEQP